MGRKSPIGVTEFVTLVIVPTYNERDNLIRLIDSIQNALPSADILVVDDNSPDGTGEIANERAKRDKQVHVIHREKKEGFGTACLTGFHWALGRDYTHLMQMDADFSHDPKFLPILLEATATHDVVLGSRWTKNGQIQGWPYHRKIMSKLANRYARTVLNTSVCDITGGYRCLRRDVLETIDLNSVTSVGYGFLIEIIWLVLQNGFQVREIPITFTDRIAGKSKLSKSTFFEALTLVWRLRWRMVRQRNKS